MFSIYPIYSGSINCLLIQAHLRAMSQIDLEKEDFEQVITFILRREAAKQGKLESLRELIADRLQASNR